MRSAAQRLIRQPARLVDADAREIVVELRDVHGLTSEEICDRLGISPGNQRILLHRGRARLRERLDGVYRGRTGEGANRG